MNRILAGFLIVFLILISGCVSTVNPVDPSDVIVNAAPMEMKEFQEKDISVNVLNNATSAIDSVSVSSFELFKVISSGNVNIPAKTKEPSSVLINVKIEAPGFKEVTNTSMLTLSYASGKDEKGNPIIKTKSVPVQTTVLPDAKLQFVGFVKGIRNVSEAEVTTWTIGKGENATITFSVKNEGRTTIDKNTLSVLVDIENKEIGGNTTVVIGEPMAMEGTSFTEGVVLPVLKNAPNGKTPVYVKLFKGDKILDSKTLTLTVKL